jgi:hypothetical protein
MKERGNNSKVYTNYQSLVQGQLGRAEISTQDQVPQHSLLRTVMDLLVFEVLRASIMWRNRRPGCRKCVTHAPGVFCGLEDTKRPTDCLPCQSLDSPIIDFFALKCEGKYRCDGRVLIGKDGGGTHCKWHHIGKIQWSS